MSKKTEKPTANVALPSKSTGEYSLRQQISANSQTIMDMLLRRSSGSSSNKREDIEKACGYETTLVFNDYFEAWDRQDVAKRVIEAYPDYTWAQNPEVYENESTAVETPFEKSWKKHVSESLPYAELHKLDILAGIGKFGVMVMGVNDGKALDTKLEAPAKGEKRSIIYYRAYTEGEAKIEEWDDELTSVRYGQPLIYKITPNNGKETETTVSGGADVATPKKTDPSIKSYKVHYSRVLHFADNALCGNVYGRERLKQVYNRISDIIKIVGGSAEMFWQGAFTGIAFEMDADTEISEADKQKMKQDIKNYMDRLQRTLLLQGVKANPLSPSLSSPLDHLDAQLTLVSIASGIPKRVLSGSEQGKMASTQDAENWTTRVGTRQINVAEPYLLKPYIKFCVDNGILDAPKDINEVMIMWPKIKAVSREDQARAAEYFTTSLETYCSKALYHAMTFEDFLYYVQGYTSSEAKQLAKRFKQESFEKIRKELIESKSSPGTEDTKTKTAKEKSKSKSSTVTKE